MNISFIFTPYSVILILLLNFVSTTSSFTLYMMGSRRGKGNIKQSLSDSSSSNSSAQNKIKSMNQGRGQEITGVTLPEEGKVKGWEFGNKQIIACAKVDGNYYALQGDCPRCAFDLYKGDIVTDPAFGGKSKDDLPRLACPTCSTTFSLKNGTHGPALKRTGLAGFVGGLAKTATVNDAAKDAKAFVISYDSESERVFCRER